MSRPRSRRSPYARPLWTGPPQFSMLDLFSGLGGASASFRSSRRWVVSTVDCEPRLEPPPSVVADLSDPDWRWEGPKPTLIWASPPCTEFAWASMPWLKRRRREGGPDMGLIEAVLRIVEEAQPTYWVLENVRGAVPFISELVGRRHRQALGPFYLWGNFPWIPCNARFRRHKRSISGTSPRLKAKIPIGISDALRLAIEADIDDPVVPGPTIRVPSMPLREGKYHSRS